MNETRPRSRSFKSEKNPFKFIDTPNEKRNSIGFTKLFKKKEKIELKNEAYIRPITNKVHTNIPLAPPPHLLPPLPAPTTPLPPLPPHLSSPHSSSSDDEESIYSTFHDSFSDSDSDCFVDAAGATQQEMEEEALREKLSQMIDQQQLEDFSKTLDEVWDISPDRVEQVAAGFWNEDEELVEKEKLAEWLGQPKSFENAVLERYMNYFVFTDLSLDQAFRKLCNKLYFKAEAQQIDRILEVFAHRYWECNPNGIYQTADIVYAIAYSLLLLNTDLHVAQGNHARMTKQEFIKNTMSTVKDLNGREEDLEKELKEMYGSVKQHQILQPNSQKQTKRRNSLVNNRRVIGLKRSVSSMIRKSARESIYLDAEEQIVPRLSISSSYNTRRESFSSVGSSVASFNSKCFSSDPPYSKEGLVMRKHLLESGSKAKNREWKECVLEVTQDGLKMYGDYKNRHSTLDVFHSRSSHASVHSQSTTSQMVGKIELSHSLSSGLPPPGYNKARPFVFSIQQADGGVYLFQTSSYQELQEWVSTCNYWAGRVSKIPLQGATSNVDHGWGACLKQKESRIQDWITPQPNMIPSQLPQEEQFKIIKIHLDLLNQEINQHRDIKLKILKRFHNNHPDYSKVLNNWENKSKYLLYEIIKYQHYSDSLENSINEKQESIDKLIYQSTSMSLFEEINQELSLQFRST